MFGFINIYKPKGITSHDVISYLRKITKIKQIGHTGTLDPFAEGVLPVCIGKSTRLIEYLADDKAYIGTVKFGVATDTYDIEGSITNKSDKKVSKEEIESALQEFRGEIRQLPPIYSAIKVQGKKLYEYARKGIDVKVEPRTVFIKELRLLNFDVKSQEAELYISCSKGTYIRSIASDLGEILGAYGHLTKLIRVKSGDFIVDNSVKLENITDMSDITNNLIQPLNVLHYPIIELSDKELLRVKNGNNISKSSPEGYVILTYNENICAIAECMSGIINCKKVFINAD